MRFDVKSKEQKIFEIDHFTGDETEPISNQISHSLLLASNYVSTLSHEKVAELKMSPRPRARE